ncbi:hypothetical protein CVD28_00580 [Bacillus sp. M6-12]|uniref:hypothetical protein n=1 Tax=Bacillus sp. M6-12 TaxID=2054166 RepID=UPI000C76D3E0|nr:hypothetical protein [Bacillus sp. M6-12]PLS18930.1 hypothetical protein CVD28_00580 [Bacillus sp. M6-12]
MDRYYLLVFNKTKEEAGDYLKDNTKGIVIAKKHEHGEELLFEVFAHPHDVEKLKDLPDTKLFTEY